MQVYIYIYSCNYIYLYYYEYTLVIIILIMHDEELFHNLCYGYIYNWKKKVWRNLILKMFCKTPMNRSKITGLISDVLKIY